mgnify:FL=1
MYKVKDHGGEKLSNNFVSIAFNWHDNTYHIIWNSRFKTPLNKTYRLSNDYDFGSIDVKDALVEAYQNPSLISLGLTLI